MCNVHLRTCPFCGSEIEYDKRVMTLGSKETEAHCTGCGIRFSYTQDYVLTTKTRIAINDSFEQVFNRRVEGV